MNIKSQKGFTGADVTVAVLIITVFTAIIAALYQNYMRTSKEVEMKSEATNYAVGIIEELKGNSQEFFNSENINERVITLADNEAIDNTGFSKTVVIKDYAAMGLKKDAEVGYVKQISVKIEYKIGKKEQSVELNTIISKEN